MKTFGKDHRISSRQARDRGDAPPLLTLDEKLEPCTVELIRPVTLESEGRTLTEIVINVPTVDDILNQQLGEQSKQSTLNALARACQTLPPEAFTHMHPYDFRRVSEIYWAYQE